MIPRIRFNKRAAETDNELETDEDVSGMSPLAYLAATTGLPALGFGLKRALIPNAVDRMGRRSVGQRLLHGLAHGGSIGLGAGLGSTVGANVGYNSLWAPGAVAGFGAGGLGGAAGAHLLARYLLDRGVWDDYYASQTAPARLEREFERRSQPA